MVKYFQDNGKGLVEVTREEVDVNRFFVTEFPKSKENVEGAKALIDTMHKATVKLLGE